jgi:transmembrane sensor
MTENSMERSKIIDLMAKKLGKSASAEELKELERLLAEYPDYAWLETVVGSLKGSPEHFERNIPVEELANSGWRQLEGRLKMGEDGSVGAEGLRVSRLWRWAAAAAVIVILAGSATWYFKGNRNPFQAQYAVKVSNVRYGSQEKLVLSDGTTVWLNAGSRLHYPDVFPGDKREVTLEGEGFFEVAKHVDMPFFVHAGKVTVKVLGTSFDVKAYREDAAITTTLISGKVQVSMDEEPDKKIILSANEKVTIMNSAPETKGVQARATNVLRYQVQRVPSVSDSLPERAWIENRLVINDETFEDVAIVLERRYNVDIEIADARLKQEHVSGIFEKETIQQVLGILEMTTKFKYSIEGKKVRLMPDQTYK